MRLVAILVLFFLPSTVYGIEMYYPSEFYQGTTMEILVPKYDFVDILGTLDGKEISFFEIEQAPRDYDLMSRGSYMELVISTLDVSKETEVEYEFPDVSADHPQADFIYAAKSLGIIDGYADGLFYPYESLTRAQAAKILMNTYALPQKTKTVEAFSDLPASHSLATYMNQAIQAELFHGYGDGTMKPDRPLNFVEAETLLLRASKLETLPPRKIHKYFRGFIGAHRVNDLGEKEFQISLMDTSGKRSTEYTHVHILDSAYPTNSFTLPPSKTELFENSKYTKTWEMIDSAKNQTNTKQLWEGAFILPAEGRISMGFGDTVYINGEFSGSHFGIDYANKTGTPVVASNHGNVVLAEETPSYGNTVIIDHGHNIFTMYMHLNSIAATKDSFVEKGEVIGEIGMTGVATGPHLHFNHFVGNVIVDSQQWYTRD